MHSAIQNPLDLHDSANRRVYLDLDQVIITMQSTIPELLEPRRKGEEVGSKVYPCLNRRWKISKRMVDFMGMSRGSKSMG